MKIIQFIKKTCFLAMLPVALYACGNGAPQSGDNAPVKPKEAKPVAPPAIEQKAAQAEPVETKISYPPSRNPFQSHIMIRKSIVKTARAKGPLECCDLGGFRVLAIVAGLEDSYALVQAPDAKRYVIRKGDTMGLNEGKVQRISPSSVVVKEIARDEEGNIVSSSEKEIKLPERK